MNEYSSDALINNDRATLGAEAPGEVTDDFRAHRYDIDDPRIASFRGLDARSYTRKRLESPFLRDVIAQWERLRAEPFTGITAEGTQTEDGLYDGPVLPGEEAPVDEIVAAATAVVDALDEEARSRVFQPADSEAWRAWSNPEFIVHDHGVRLEDIGEQGKAAVAALLTATLGEDGAQVVSDLRELNHQLGQLLALPMVMNRDSYHFTIFGTPGRDQAWGWQLFGHHVAVNVVMDGPLLRLGPVFLGAEPNILHDDAEGTVLLAARQRLALSFAGSLSQDQRDRMRVYDSVRSASMPPSRLHPIDERMVAGAFQDNHVVSPEGLPAAELDPTQEEHLLALIAECVQPLPAGPLHRRLREIAAHLGETWITWIGSVEDDGQPFYFRIHSPVLLTEFDHHAGVWLSNQFPAKFHIHTIQRQPNGGDYGGLLVSSGEPRQVRTTQLRRYEIKPELFDSFLSWWRHHIVPVREGAGFEVGVAFADRAECSLVWSVSVEGDANKFAEVESAYSTSSARAAVFDGAPEWLISSDVRFVNDEGSAGSRKGWS